MAKAFTVCVIPKLGKMFIVECLLLNVIAEMKNISDFGKKLSKWVKV